MKIRGRTDLTEARDELVAHLKSMTAELETCQSIRDLDKLIWSLKLLRVTEAIADLANALEIDTQERPAQAPDEAPFEGPTNPPERI